MLMKLTIARETEVFSGTKNAFQFNFLGTSVSAYHVLFAASECGNISWAHELLFLSS